jgi:hypothetical protein
VDGRADPRDKPGDGHDTCGTSVNLFAAWYWLRDPITSEGTRTVRAAGDRESSSCRGCTQIHADAPLPLVASQPTQQRKDRGGKRSTGPRAYCLCGEVPHSQKIPSVCPEALQVFRLTWTGMRLRINRLPPPDPHPPNPAVCTCAASNAGKRSGSPRAMPHSVATPSTRA